MAFDPNASYSELTWQASSARDRVYSYADNRKRIFPSKIAHGIQSGILNSVPSTVAKVVHSAPVASAPYVGFGVYISGTTVSILH